MSTEIRTIDGVYEVKETIAEVFHSEEKGYYKVSQYETYAYSVMGSYQTSTNYEVTQTVYINKSNVISIK
jgi:uncharacterized protein (UPF0297 family)